MPTQNLGIGKSSKRVPGKTTKQSAVIGSAIKSEIQTPEGRTYGVIVEIDSNCPIRPGDSRFGTNHRLGYHAEMTGEIVVHAVDHSSIFCTIKRGLWDQVQYVRHGLPSEFVVEMSDALDMPRSTLLENLKLARSTIESRIKSKKALSPAEGDAVLRAAKALTRAQEVFEDNAAAAAWIKRPNRSLGGATPVSLIDTDSGYELVMDTLGRIEHGVVA
jgi:putative toxin-antitoxin system antitoxin component (TIGR02293 family)